MSNVRFIQFIKLIVTVSQESDQEDIHFVSKKRKKLF